MLSMSTRHTSRVLQPSNLSQSVLTFEVLPISVEQVAHSKRKSIVDKEADILQKSVEFFVNASDVKVRGNVELKLSLEAIEKHAEEHGLKQDHISQLVDVAACNKLPERINVRLIRSLIPRTVVPEEAVNKAVSWICTNKPSSNIQCVLLRWMLVVYDYMESHEGLHRLYTFLFYFMESDTLCPHVCSLLHRLTRLTDVKLFRVKALLQLQQRKGVQPHLTGLLTLYKSYCPHLIAISLPRRKQVFFKNHDRVWSLKVKRIQDLRNPSPEPPVSQTTTTALSSKDSSQPVNKRRRSELIPASVITVHNTRRTDADKFRYMLENISSIKLPGQMGSVLHERDLQYLLLFHKDPVAPIRFQYWLEHVLYNDVIGAGSDHSAQVDELLASLVHLSDFLQEGVPICEDFLAHFLHMWNGKDYAPYVFKLLSRIRIHSYADLTNLLEPLRNLFFTSSIYIKCQIMLCLEELIKNYALVELERLHCTQQCQSIVGIPQNPGKHVHSPACYSVFVEKVEEEGDVSGLNTLLELEDFAQALGALALRQEDYHVLLTHSVLSFCEQVASLQSSRHLPHMSPPREELVYACLFSDNAMALVRMVALMCRHRANFQKLRKMDSSMMSEEEQKIRRLGLMCSKIQNMYILDFVNTLWLYKAFNCKTSQEFDSVYSLLPEETRTRLVEEKAGCVLSIHEHQAFLPYSHHFLTLTQPADAVVHPRAIKAARDTYMEYLDQEHLVAISEFISTMVKRNSAARNASLSSSINAN